MLRIDPLITNHYYLLQNHGVDKLVLFKNSHDYQRMTLLLHLANSHNTFRLEQLLKFQHKTPPEILEMDTDAPLVSIGAWCLTPQSFYLVVRQEEDEGIPKFMRKLGTAYSMYFNIKYERQGALFGGPFKSARIAKTPADLT